MLKELGIHNYALIERVTIKFRKGFNVLTGETGAGKSILVDALGLLLGQKADPSTVRTGARETLVSGLVSIADNPEALKWVEEHGITPEDRSIMLRRVSNKSGKGSIFVQAVPVTRAELAELSSMLFDLHGQHDHQSLLDVNNHRKLIDRFAEAEELANQTAELYSKLVSLRESYEKVTGAERERLREMDLLGYAVEEINRAQLRPGEEEELEAEYKRLSNYERLFKLLEEVYGIVSESREGSLMHLRRCMEAMDEIVQIDSSLSRLVNQLQDAFYELEDFSESIRTYISSVEFDAERLQTTEERLFLIRELEKKYGDTVQDVLAYSGKCKNDLEELEHWEDKKKELEKEIRAVEQVLHKKATELSERRKLTASRLEKMIEEELAHLSMRKVRFRAVVQTRKDSSDKPVINKTGMDIIEFAISTNPGEPFKRLRKIASGGELSRIMLAIKSVLANSDHIDTLIFDEVDSGIGGEVAVSVGERLHRLAKAKQILCITHLATIAVRADHHLKVEKAVSGDRTRTTVTPVSGDRKMEEISRMLAGDSTNTTALKHAEELLKKYGTVREN